MENTCSKVKKCSDLYVHVVINNYTNKFALNQRTQRGIVDFLFRFKTYCISIYLCVL